MKTTLAWLGIFLVSVVRAETSDCTEITGVPYFITAPGNYCLKRSLTTPGPSGIGIGASDVTLDLNGHTIEITGTAGSGISSSGRSNVTVRNGTIRGGDRGVSLQDQGTSVVVERMRVERSLTAGIWITGNGGVVRDNVVVEVGGGGLAGPRWAISADNGTGIVVSGNQVLDTGVGTNSEADGIRVANAPGALIERNVIGNTVPGGAASNGILIFRTPGFATPMTTTVVGNRVTKMRFGISNRADRSLFLDNAVGGAGTQPFTGGVMAGATNVAF